VGAAAGGRRMDGAHLRGARIGAGVAALDLGLAREHEANLRGRRILRQHARRRVGAGRQASGRIARRIHRHRGVDAASRRSRAAPTLGHAPTLGDHLGTWSTLERANRRIRQRNALEFSR
jgi:hypothetical protein